ncbi:MAG: HNH endonuclease family protein [Cellulomonas sp.]|uniref:HNH endonuclease family protein n=1 Tax=Cellulomonas sp. TaxID=40001 RepID=UPI002586DFEF|nr:HNH endonuclease family protein [Cellulomonas sp.]MCR6706179.1 HNH endonuclease family protein [Cellulomonas sp.]
MSPGKRESHGAWPTDTEFIGGLMNSDLYNAVPRARLRSLLTGLDTALITARGERVEPLPATQQSLTIEHVLPQQWSTHWPLPAGDVERLTAVRQQNVHVLGNLTLTTGKVLNSSLSNAPWVEKRPTLQKHSLLRLTTASILTVPDGISGWTAAEWEADWDEMRIGARTVWLIQLALATWSRPKDLEETETPDGY